MNEQQHPAVGGAAGKRTGPASSPGPAVGGSPGSVHKKSSAPAVGSATGSGSKTSARVAGSGSQKSAPAVGGAAAGSSSRRAGPARGSVGRAAQHVEEVVDSDSSSHSYTYSEDEDERPAVGRAAAPVQLTPARGGESDSESDCTEPWHWSTESKLCEKKR